MEMILIHGLRMACAFGIFATALSAFSQIKATTFASGFSLPIAIIQDPVFADTQYVVQQRGLVRTVVDGVVQGTNAMSLVGIASTSGSERGLLGLAFHPNYPTQPYIYVNYTSQADTHATKIVRYTRNAINHRTFDVGTAQTVIQIAQPFSNHNGGTIRFGPDGMLYIGMGDGGSANDPNNAAQNLTNLLGKILRLDITGDDFPADPLKNYKIPTGQPFSVTGGTLAPEIWSFGIRNPWKWSFDNPAMLGTGGMLMADVGQNQWEEVNYEPAATGGRNYGWRPREGLHATGLSGGPNGAYVDPIWEYSHAVGQSITGGYVYRGIKLGDMFGRYFFADYVASQVWSAKLTINGVTGEASAVAPADVTNHTADLAPAVLSGVSSFDVDENGEIYVISYGNGTIYRIDPEGRFYITEIKNEQGFNSGGQIRSLLANDDKYYNLVSDYTEDTVLGEGGVLRVAHLNDVMPTFLNLSVICKSNQPTGLPVRLGLWNWSTGRVDFVSGPTNVAMPETALTATPAPTNYVRASDRRVELYISVGSGAIVDPSILSIDQVKIN